LLFLAVWQTITMFFLEDFVLPPPAVVGREMVTLLTSGELWEHARFSLQRLFLAFALTLLIGIIVGLAMGMNRWLDGFFRDFSVIMFTTPTLIFVLITGLIFGISYVGPIVAIVLASFSYVSFNLWEGVRAVPKDLLDMGNSYKMRGAARIRHIIIPAVAPYLFQGARFAFAMTWKVALLAEVFGGNQGIGYRMGLAYQSFHMSALLAWVLWFLLSALFFERFVLQQLENRSLRWRPDIGGR
jgi:NitT/TauT family transport system permease protein